MGNATLNSEGRVAGKKVEQMQHRIQGVGEREGAGECNIESRGTNATLNSGGGGAGGSGGMQHGSRRETINLNKAFAHLCCKHDFPGIRLVGVGNNRVGRRFPRDN